MAITPDYVNSLTLPTEHFLCPKSHNVYKIDFVAFKIRAVHEQSESVLFEIQKDADDEGPCLDDNVDDTVRSIRYHFGPSFLEYPTIGTTLEFTVGEYPLHNFRMIERHYFGDILIKSFDFTLPFVIPNTSNTWEVIYTMPELDPMLKQSIMANPWATKSDSFYFVNDQLVMHNKAGDCHEEERSRGRVRGRVPHPLGRRDGAQPLVGEARRAQLRKGHGPWPRRRWPRPWPRPAPADVSSLSHVAYRRRRDAQAPETQDRGALLRTPPHACSAVRALRHRMRGAVRE